MDSIETAGLVYNITQKGFDSMAKAIPEGPSFRLVKEYKAVNQQVAVVPWPYLTWNNPSNISKARVVSRPWNYHRNSDRCPWMRVARRLSPW